MLHSTSRMDRLVEHALLRSKIEVGNRRVTVLNMGRCPGLLTSLIAHSATKIKQGFLSRDQADTVFLQKCFARCTH